MQKPEIQNKKTSILLFAALIVAVSFFRDHVFRSVNEQLRLNFYQEVQHPYSFLEPLFSKLSTESLNNLKFVLTFAFSAVFLFITVRIVRKFFRKPEYIRYTIWAFSIVFAVAMIFFFAGYLFPSVAESLYELARFLTGFLQSPLLTMVLCAAFILDTRVGPQQQ